MDAVKFRFHLFYFLLKVMRMISSFSGPYLKPFTVHPIEKLGRLLVFLRAKSTIFVSWDNFEMLCN